MKTLRLSLRQNALHTLHHGVEHLYWSESDRDTELGRCFDDDDHSVEWRDADGHVCFSLGEFTRPPAEYHLKFALMHLLQAAELLLKCYVDQVQPTALFVDAKSRRTIDFRTALDFTVVRNPNLLSREQYALLLEVKDLRNAVEHYELAFAQDRFQGLCRDFLATCALLAQALISVNINEAFSWDYLKDAPDPVADYLAATLGRVSPTGQDATRKAGELWASTNREEPMFLCLNCGGRTVSAKRGVCMGCGAEGDSELVALLEDFDANVRRIVELQSKLLSDGPN